jgi:hypothetical protein
MMEVQEDIVDVLLRYGLFVGAIFQLVCIGAVIIMPDSKSDGLNDSDVSEDEPSASDRESPQISPNHKQYRSKREKKKRR